MKIYTRNPTTVLSKWTRFLGVPLCAGLLVALMVPAVAVSQTAPALGTSTSFGILAAGAITGTTSVTGNVGTSTADAIDVTIAVAGGYTKYAPADAVVVTAHNDFLTAYGNVTSQNPDGSTLAAAFGSATPLTSGIYIITAPASMTTDLTLNGPGIFIFKTLGTLNTSAGTVVHLTGGAVWTNVFWQVGAGVTLGAGSSIFEGTILGNTDITVGATATMHGRLLGNGAVSVSDASIGASEIPLPVELVAFTATANRLNADLRWSTATEVNNFGFEVQRSALSAQNSDKSWAKTGFVEGNGTTNAPKDYSFTDNNLSSGKYSYRLKQIDRDGKFEYSQSVEVTIGLAPQKFALLQNYPNPFNPSTVISYQLAANSQVTLKVYDLLGLEVATLVNGRQEAGSYTVPFSAIGGSTIASGVYFYRLEAGSFVSTKKLVVMK